VGISYHPSFYSHTPSRIHSFPLTQNSFLSSPLFGEAGVLKRRGFDWKREIREYKNE
jgi:hypothetical protein